PNLTFISSHRAVHNRDLHSFPTRRSSDLEAGSTALQELAFTIYDGVEYVEWALRRGLNVDEFAPRLSFFFNSHNDFFEEIAKFRSEEHTSELQSLRHLVCRLLLEKKK